MNPAFAQASPFPRLLHIAEASDVLQAFLGKTAGTLKMGPERLGQEIIKHKGLHVVGSSFSQDLALGIYFSFTKME